MSVQASTHVWKCSRAEGTELLVLLAIADAADQDGTNAWPGVARIARLTKVSERTVQRALRSLEDSGEIVTERQAGGVRETPADQRPNRYQVVCPACFGVTPMTPPAEDSGCQPQLSGVTPSADRGDTRDTQPALEPPSTHPPAPRSRRRDPFFDALVDVFGPASTGSRASFYGATIRELRDAGATPEQVLDRGRRCRERFTDATPKALVKHWDALAPPAEQASPLHDELAELNRRARAERDAHPEHHR